MSPSNNASPSRESRRIAVVLAWLLGAVGGWLVGVAIDAASGIPTTISRLAIGCAVLAVALVGFTLRRLPHRAPIQGLAFRICAILAAATAIASMLLTEPWTPWLIFSAAALTILSSLTLAPGSGLLGKLATLGVAGVGLSFLGFLRAISPDEIYRDWLIGLLLVVGSCLVAGFISAASAIGRAISGALALALTSAFIATFVAETSGSTATTPLLLTITIIFLSGPALGLCEAASSKPILAIAGCLLGAAFLTSGATDVPNMSGIAAILFGGSLFLMSIGLALEIPRMATIGGLGCAGTSIGVGISYLLSSDPTQAGAGPYRLLGTALMLIGIAAFAGLATIVLKALIVPERLKALLRDPTPPDPTR